MFLGQHTYTLDDKGRLTIPSRFRDEFAGSAVVTRGFDRCLFVFPLEVWQGLADKVTALPVTEPRGRVLRRQLFAEAANVELDRQGRILLPDRLRDYAGLELTSDAVIVGLNSFVELWSPQRWEQENARQTEIVDEDPELWQGLGI